MQAQSAAYAQLAKRASSAACVWALMRSADREDGEQQQHEKAADDGELDGCEAGVVARAKCGVCVSWRSPVRGRAEALPLKMWDQTIASVMLVDLGRHDVAAEGEKAATAARVTTRAGDGVLHRRQAGVVGVGLDGRGELLNEVQHFGFAPWLFPDPRQSGWVASEHAKDERETAESSRLMIPRARTLRTVPAMPLPALVQKHALSAVTALLFGLAFWRLGLSPELPAVLAFIFGGVLLAVIDWKVHRLPTRLVYYTLAGVTAGLAFASLVEWDWKPLATAFAGAALFSGAYFLIWFLSPRMLGMVVLGFGDVRLALVLGALLGWYGLEYVVYGALLGHLLAPIVGLGLCIRERKLRLSFAFGPPLLIGTLAVVLLQA